MADSAIRRNLTWFRAYIWLSSAYNPDVLCQGMSLPRLARFTGKGLSAPSHALSLVHHHPAVGRICYQEGMLIGLDTPCMINNGNGMTDKLL